MRNLACTLVTGVLLMSGCGRNILVVGHRGSPGAYPENTLPSFHAAVVAGADWVELDSRVGASGTIYCLHDATLDRTTDAVAVLGGEKIRLENVDDAGVARLDAGSWFAGRFAGVSVPRLAEALDVIQVGSKTLLERKDGPADTYAEMLQRKGLVGRLVVQSFDWEFLEALHALLPDQPLGALGSKPLDDERFERLARTGASYVGWSQKDLSADVIDRLHAAGYKVLAYTVNEEDDWRRLMCDGIDGIITNRPGDLRKWVDARRLWP